jgi:hypothetical protein
MPIPANAGTRPLTLLDATVANPVGVTLYSALVSDLEAFLFAIKPASVPVTPGSPVAPPAGSLFMNASIPFANGLYVKSCPDNVTFTATTS